VVTIVDTSVLVAFERGHLNFGDVPFGSATEIVISTITVAELLHGVHRATNPAQRARRESFTRRLIDEETVLAFDLAAASVHARISADLASRGVTVGAHDLLIAATAISVGGRVATRDLRSFPKIPGLEILAC
jgi:predicted nucleic acid-binding protein